MGKGSILEINQNKTTTSGVFKRFICEIKPLQHEVVNFKMEIILLYVTFAC